MNGNVSVSYERICGGGEKLCVNGSASLSAFAGAHIEGEVSATHNPDGIEYTGSAGA